MNLRDEPRMTKQKIKSAIYKALFGCWWGVLGVRILHECNLYLGDYFLALVLVVWFIPGWYLYETAASWLTWPRGRE